MIMKDTEEAYRTWGEDGRGQAVYGQRGYVGRGADCQVASSSAQRRANHTYVNIGRKTNKHGKTKKFFDVSVGSSRQNYGQTSTGCIISDTVVAHSNVTCSIDQDCEGLPVEGKMIDAYCDSEGYCRID